MNVDAPRQSSRRSPRPLSIAFTKTGSVCFDACFWNRADRISRDAVPGPRPHDACHCGSDCPHCRHRRCPASLGNDLSTFESALRRPRQSNAASPAPQSMRCRPSYRLRDSRAGRHSLRVATRPFLLWPSLWLLSPSRRACRRRPGAGAAAGHAVRSGCFSLARRLG